MVNAKRIKDDENLLGASYSEVGMCLEMVHDDGQQLSHHQLGTFKSFIVSDYLMGRELFPPLLLVSGYEKLVHIS